MLQGHTRAVSSLALGADGEVLVSGSEDGTARVWDLRSRQPVQVGGGGEVEGQGGCAPLGMGVHQKWWGMPLGEHTFIGTPARDLWLRYCMGPATGPSRVVGMTCLR